ncbi:serine/threonine protein kinase [Candidatus Uabimicrobium sp. HlEnr_7]|uniref:serine/threonine protein kinase n=1 Tax=Candidatus Uabimicrobium helgolandensis TaxID=3095367 RepID=UPI0035579D00
MKEYNLRCRCGNSVRIVTPKELRANIICQLCGKSMYSKGPKQDTSKHYRRIGNYLLLKSLGKGGMSEVFLGYDETSHEKVAVKMTDVTKDAHAQQHFDREVDVLRRLHHPNIIRLHHWGQDGNNVYYVMDYHPGKSVEDILQRGLPTLGEALRITYYTLDALQYAHSKSIVHRDIKPGNIYITTEDRTVKILDLGIAKAGYDKESLVKTGEMIGTIFYMALEQFRDSKHIDHRADIYAVGATLFRILCRYPPFAEHGRDLQKIFLSKAEDSYVKLLERKSDIPQSVVDVVEKAMAPEAEDRYQTAEEMKEAVYEQLTNVC